jgi:hypothetical protein
MTKKDDTVVRALIQRIIPYKHGLFRLSGPISSIELDALRTLAGLTAGSSSQGELGEQTNAPELIILDRTLINKVEAPAGLLCVDFGTAASKIAMDGLDGPEPLPIGARAGDPGTNATFLSPSAIAVADGLIQFGWRAEVAAESDVNSPVIRSLKSKLWGDPQVLEEIGLRVGAVLFTYRDLLVLYLAYLTRLATAELRDRELDPHVPRRYAMPFAYDEAHEDIRDEFGKVLSVAAVLADSLGDTLLDGLEPGTARLALDAAQGIRVPDWFLEQPEPCVGEPIAAGNFSMRGELGDRTLYMILDLGAGTTDLCVMALNRKFGEIRPITIPGGALSIEWAGDHLDDLVIEHLAETQAPGEESRLARMKRDLKERLFRDGVIDLELSDVSLYLTREEFLGTEQWKRFESRLREAQGRCIDQIDHGYWNNWGNSAVRIVITGGGAYLPLENLQTGRIGDRNVSCQGVEGLPEELQLRYEEMIAELPRLVVAIGGASEELPEPLDRRSGPMDPDHAPERRLVALNKSESGLEDSTITL